MASTNETYDFAADCESFDHSTYLTGDRIEFLGNPTSVQDIPNETIYGNVDNFKRSVLGMHQLITQMGLWRRLGKQGIEYKLSGPKLDETGHSGSTFYFTWGQMRFIAANGWEAWVAKWEKIIQEKALEEKKEAL